MALQSGIDLPLEQIADICRRYHVRELAVFGSAVRGASCGSDIDLLVEFDPAAPVSYFDLFAMEGELGSLLGRKVEATTRRGLKPWIRSQVEQDAQTIYHAA
jgi:predicted nucleotidyltransferase